MSDSVNEDDKRWYVVEDPSTREYLGPFSVAEISRMVRQKDLDINRAWAFNKNDTSMIPVKSIEGVDQRGPLLPINKPVPQAPGKTKDQETEKAWYVAGDGNSPQGPFSEEDLHRLLKDGEVYFDTYVWKKGMDQWVYLHEVPGFERRQSS